MKVVFWNSVAFDRNYVNINRFQAYCSFVCGRRAVVVIPLSSCVFGTCRVVSVVKLIAWPELFGINRGIFLFHCFFFFISWRSLQPLAFESCKKNASYELLEPHKNTFDAHFKKAKKRNSFRLCIFQLMVGYVCF